MEDGGTEDSSIDSHFDSRSTSELIEPLSADHGCCRKFGKNLLRFFRGINAEPALFLFSIHMGIMYSLQQPFLYFRKCIDIYYDLVPHPHKFCHNLSSYNTTNAEDLVSYNVDTLSIWIQVATCLPAVIMCPLLGAWSDASGGRKKPILIALAGVCLMDVTYILCIVRHKISLDWLILGCGISGLGGQQMIIYAVGFALITDDARSKTVSSTPSSRTLSSSGNSEQDDETEKWVSVRISIGSGIVSFGMLCGSLIETWLRSINRLESESFLYSMFIAEGSVALAFGYTLVVVRDRLTPDLADLADSDSHSPRFGLIQIVWKRLKASVHTLISPRAGYQRFCLLMTLFLHTLFICWYYGTETIILLFVKRSPLAWSDAQYGFYNSFLFLAGAIGMTAVPPLFQKCLPASILDTTIILVGIVFSSAFYVTIGVSKADWSMWLAGCFLLLADLDEPGFQAFYSKLVNEDETARIFSIMAILQNVAPILGTSLFNSVYSNTVSTFAGFAFVLAGGLHLPVFVGILFIQYFLKRGKQNSMVASEEGSLSASSQQSSTSDLPSELSTEAEDT